MNDESNALIPGLTTAKDAQGISEAIVHAIQDEMLSPEDRSTLSAILSTSLTQSGGTDRDLAPIVATVSKLDQDELRRLLRLVIRPRRKRELFVFPSNQIMFAILALFVGKNERIPRLLKPYADMNDAEREASDRLLLRYMNVDEVDPKGRPLGLIAESDGYETKRRYNVFAVRNPKIRAWASIGGDLFAEGDLLEQQRMLSAYLAKTFGPRGLKHFLAFLIQLDDAGRSGTFVLDLDRHADLVGARSQEGGTYRDETKAEAVRFLFIIANLYLTTVWNEGDREGLEGIQLFNIPRFNRKAGPEGIVDSIEVEAGRAWYRNAIAPESGTPQFVNLYRKIAAENAREHRNAILLTPLLSVYWRIEHGDAKRLRLRNLLEWCDLLPDDDRHFRRNLATFTSELDFMTHAGYLDDWHFDEPTNDLAGDELLDSTLTLSPPDYLAQSLAKLRPAITADATIDRATFVSIYKQSGLTQRQFANRLGVGQSRIGMILNGHRTVAADLSARIQERFADEWKAVLKA